MVKNLKLLRTQKGISQQKLANEIGISQQSINKYENQNIEPDINTLIALADYFETTVDYLIGRTDN
ncbi:MAG: helix-turn-helix domain-containing protein, partial [Lachnospiraceae bacterium]